MSESSAQNNQRLDSFIHYLNDNSAQTKAPVKYEFSILKEHQAYIDYRTKKPFLGEPQIKPSFSLQKKTPKDSKNTIAFKNIQDIYLEKKPKPKNFKEKSPKNFNLKGTPLNLLSETQEKV